MACTKQWEMDLSKLCLSSVPELARCSLFSVAVFCTNKPGDRLVTDKHGVALNNEPRLGTVSKLA